MCHERAARANNTRSKSTRGRGQSRLENMFCTHQSNVIIHDILCAASISCDAVRSPCIHAGSEGASSVENDGWGHVFPACGVFPKKCLVMPRRRQLERLDGRKQTRFIQLPMEQHMEVAPTVRKAPFLSASVVHVPFSCVFSLSRVLAHISTMARTASSNPSSVTQAVARRASVWQVQVRIAGEHITRPSLICSRREGAQNN